jgi:hypothetical protein
MTGSPAAVTNAAESAYHSVLLTIPRLYSFTANATALPATMPAAI